MMRSMGAGSNNNWNKAAIPNGFGVGSAWMLPKVVGGMVSRKLARVTVEALGSAALGSLIFTSSCVIGLDGAATGTLIVGSLIDGTTAIVIDGSAVGRMTLGAVGEATITIETNGAILGHVPAEGSTAILLGAIADLNALGWLAGNGPLGLDGTLQTYAVGWMEGSTQDKGTLTTTNIATAVWDALQANINTSGSAGAALLAAGSAGDPWSTLLANYTDDATFGAYMKKLLSTGQFIALK
jgi:hypothetical protein